MEEKEGAFQARIDELLTQNQVSSEKEELLEQAQSDNSALDAKIKSLVEAEATARSESEAMIKQLESSLAELQGKLDLSETRGDKFEGEVELFAKRLLETKEQLETSGERIRQLEEEAQLSAQAGERIRQLEEEVQLSAQAQEELQSMLLFVVSFGFVFFYIFSWGVCVLLSFRLLSFFSWHQMKPT